MKTRELIEILMRQDPEADAKVAIIVNKRTELGGEVVVGNVELAADITEVYSFEKPAIVMLEIETASL
jgi:hypothetical protein